MEEKDRIQYIVRVLEVRPTGEWPVATAHVTVGGDVPMVTGDAGRAFSALYNVIQRVVKLFVARNLSDALTMAAEIGKKINAGAAEPGGGEG